MYKAAVVALDLYLSYTHTHTHTHTHTRTHTHTHTHTHLCYKASGIEGVDVIAADVRDDDSLEEMCSKTKVLISCVGPVSGVGRGSG